uniref:Purine nucleoside phosphorylase n=1 Tax=Prevotella sp. GTC17259 TaxID=3236795 RepID=A0AB33JCR4_9BACT
MLMAKPVLHTYRMAEGVTAFSTTRHGGTSKGKYGELNINPYCGDDADAVAANRAALCALLGIDDGQLLLPHQVHGTENRLVSTDFFALPSGVRRMVLDGADSIMTNVEGVCIGVSTADCIPVLLYDPVHRAACAIHAGWRGTVKRIVLKSVAEMVAAYDTRPSDLLAVVGPGISVEHFEVGQDVYEQFEQAAFDMAAISRKLDKWHIDLPECNRLQLLQAGVNEGGIHMSGICTYTRSDEFFSARRLGVDSGRIFTGILLTETV